MYDIVAIGSAFVDYFIEKDDAFLDQYGLAPEDDFLFVEKNIDPALILSEKNVRTKSAGGMSFNTIAVLQNLGAHTAYYGILGNDEESQIFRSFGVDLSHVKHSGRTSRCACILTHHRTHRTFLSEVNSSEHEFFQNIDYTLLNSTHYVHITPFFFENSLDLLATSIPRIKTAKISFTPGISSIHQAPTLLRKLLPAITILFVNEHELFMLLHKNPTEGSKEIIKQGTQIVVCTMGERGALITTQQEQLSISANKVRHVVDTTGAGDTFAAGFLFGLLHNKSVYASAQIASDIAAQSLSDFGLNWLKHK